MYGHVTEMMGGKGRKDITGKETVRARRPHLFLNWIAGEFSWMYRRGVMGDKIRKTSYSQPVTVTVWHWECGEGESTSYAVEFRLCLGCQ